MDFLKTAIENLAQIASSPLASGYTKLLPLSQAIKPGEPDHFVVRIGTDKSARFDLQFSLRDAGGSTIPTQNVDLEIFVPRSFKTEGELVRKGKTWKTAATKQTSTGGL